MHRVAYLGGDADLYCTRRATDADVRLVIDYPEHRAMLTIVVTKDGELALDMGPNQGGRAVHSMTKIGQLAINSIGELVLAHTQHRDIDLDEPALVLREVSNRSEEPVLTNKKAAPD